MLLSPREWLRMTTPQFVHDQSDESSTSDNNNSSFSNRKRYKTEYTNNIIQKPQHVQLTERIITKGIPTPNFEQLGEHVHTRIDWQTMPTSFDPLNYMGRDRGLRKRQQIQNMICVLDTVLENTRRNLVISKDSPSSQVYSDIAPIRIVDFCCGSGHLGLVIAFIYGPKVQVTLIERNPLATVKARERIAELDDFIASSQSIISPNVNKINVITGSIEDFHEEFDVGVAIHACGPLTDMIHLKCLQFNASYVLCPCCVGKVQQYHASSQEYHDVHTKSANQDESSHHRNEDRLIYPRSRSYTQLLLSDPLNSVDQNNSPKSYDPSDYNAKREWNRRLQDYFDLSKYGDYGEWEFDSKKAIERRLCKGFIESDRNAAASEKGYRTWLIKMKPEACTPKNDIIAGLFVNN